MPKRVTKSACLYIGIMTGTRSGTRKHWRSYTKITEHWKKFYAMRTETALTRRYCLAHFLLAEFCRYSNCIGTVVRAVQDTLKVVIYRVFLSKH